MMRAIGLFLLLTTMFLGACKDESCEGSFCLNVNAEISVLINGEVIPKGQTLVIGNVAVGETVVGATVTFTNLGDADLVVRQLTLASSPGGALTVDFGSDEAPSEAAPWVITATGTTAQTTRSFDIILERVDPEATISGTLTVASNSSLNDALELSFPIEVVDLIARLNTSETLDFSNVTEGKEEVRPLIIVNDGNAELLIHALRLSGGSAYRVVHDGNTWQGSDESPATVAFESPIRVGPGKNLTLQVHFSPQTPDPHPGELRLLSNDPESGEEGTSITLTGNMLGACFTTNPKTVDFGALPVGKSKTVDVTIISCGTKALEVSAINVEEGSSEEFSVDLLGLPTGGLPLVLEVGATATVRVAFGPGDASPKDASGDPIPQIGKVTVMTNTFVPERTLQMSGSGAQCCACPVAVVQVKQGPLVTPQTNIELVGESSYTPFGEISAYAWTVDQPVGATGVFLPDATAPNPTFLANMAGVYTFKLRVWDDEALESCVEDTMVVDVKPDEAIHVELLWNNALDEDPADATGSDLDLHFLHPAGLINKPDVDGDGEPDGYFDAKWDCFWYNPKGNWDSPISEDDDASLDLDDKNGAGPENVNLKEPALGTAYRVGVHYWKENDMGPADVTLRFFVKGDLVAELTLPGLHQGELWDAATVEWDGETATVSPLKTTEGDDRVIPDYPLPPQLPSD